MTTIRCQHKKTKEGILLLELPSTLAHRPLRRAQKGSKESSAAGTKCEQTAKQAGSTLRSKRRVGRDEAESHDRSDGQPEKPLIQVQKKQSSTCVLITQGTTDIDREFMSGSGRVKSLEGTL